MLIIPLEGKISWRNPPVVTLALIVINCFVFFAFQWGDGQKTFDAYQYYFESGLARIELPRYADHVAEATGTAVETGDLSEPDATSVGHMVDMQRDSDFMQSLYHDAVITPDSADYDEWQEKRAAFDSRMDRVVSHRYGLVPAEVKPWMFLTMMFLHGGLGHLIGNMVFLWIVGCVLEMGLGRVLYGIGYILVGIFAAAVYFVVHHNSYVPSIGASGAISGLMGALTVLYGITRIRVFFTTGFYFDYFRMPAVLLLPFWLAKELLAFYLGSSAGVAYMAHAGGLFGGALLGIGGRHMLGPAGKAYFEEKPEDPTPKLMEAALERISKLDFDGARSILQQVIAVQPGNLEALAHLFNLEKQAPQTREFHEAARQYLTALVENPANFEKTFDVYSQYAHLADRPGLPTHLYARLASVFMDAGKVEAGKKIVVNLIRYRPNLEVIPALLLRLITALEKRDMPDKAQKYRKILASRYPHSQEARIASATNASA